MNILYLVYDRAVLALAPVPEPVPVPGPGPYIDLTLLEARACCDLLTAELMQIGLSRLRHTALRF